MIRTEYFGLEKPERTEKINLALLNRNTDEIDTILQRYRLTKSIIGQELNVTDATGPSFTIKNNTPSKTTVVFEEPARFTEDLLAGESKTYMKNSTDSFSIILSSSVTIMLTYDVHPKTYISKLAQASELEAMKEDISILQNEKSDVYSKSDTDNLLSVKADKSDTYTKSETDSKITEKVAEIVAGAPDDFNTLKEMSDWLLEHEDSAAAMNSDIQKNKTDILSANAEIAKKVDKVPGKSLVSDSEITRLAGVDNYDDTTIKNDIAGVKSQAAINKATLGTQCKNLLKNTATTTTKKGIKFTVNADKSVTVNGTSTARADFFLAGVWGSTTPIFAKNSYKASILPNVETTDRGLYMHVVNNETVLNGVSTKDKYKVVNNEITAVYLSISAGKTFDNYTVYPMLTYADITDTTYESYQPSLQDQINALTARIAALEGIATTAE